MKHIKYYVDKEAAQKDELRHQIFMECVYNNYIRLELMQEQSSPFKFVYSSHDRTQMWARIADVWR